MVLRISFEFGLFQLYLFSPKFWQSVCECFVVDGRIDIEGVMCRFVVPLCLLCAYLPHLYRWEKRKHD